MKQSKISALILVPFFLLIVLLILWSTFSSPLEFKKDLEVPEANIVLNYSTVEYADTLVQIGLEYLGISDVKITIVEARPHVINQINPGGITRAFVVQNPTDIISIYIDPSLSKERFIRIIAHELIHIQQIYEGRLKALTPILSIWEGDTVDVRTWEYINRPWEREAFSRERELARYIKDKVAS